jgi:glycosyltransferase involved in cell wall biosynthesis
MKISIIIPVYNEEKTIEKIFFKILSLKLKKKQIIIVDDCSIDKTRKILNKKIFLEAEQIIFHKKNLGKGAAIRTAQKYVTGDIVIIQDADLEYNPKDYNKLIQPIIKKEFNVVYGSRVLGRFRYNAKGFISLSRVFFNHALTVISNIINHQNLTDAHTCYKVFSGKFFKKLTLIENDFAFCPEVTTKISNLGEKIIEVPISYIGRSREEGKKIGIYDGFRALYVLIKYKFFRL